MSGKRQATTAKRKASPPPSESGGESDGVSEEESEGGSEGGSVIEIEATEPEGKKRKASKVRAIKVKVIVRRETEESTERDFNIRNGTEPPIEQDVNTPQGREDTNSEEQQISDPNQKQTNAPKAKKKKEPKVYKLREQYPKKRKGETYKRYHERLDIERERKEAELKKELEKGEDSEDMKFMYREEMKWCRHGIAGVPHLTVDGSPLVDVTVQQKVDDTNYVGDLKYKNFKRKIQKKRNPFVPPRVITRRTWNIPRAALCYVSPWFRRQLENGEKTRIFFEDTSPIAFDYFVTWLHTGRTQPNKSAGVNFVHAFMLGCDLECPIFQDLMMMLLIEAYDFTLLHRDTIKLIMRYPHKYPKLEDFVLAQYVYQETIHHSRNRIFIHRCRQRRSKNFVRRVIDVMGEESLLLQPSPPGSNAEYRRGSSDEDSDEETRSEKAKSQASEPEEKYVSSSSSDDDDNDKADKSDKSDEHDDEDSSGKSSLGPDSTQSEDEEPEIRPEDLVPNRYHAEIDAPNPFVEMEKWMTIPGWSTVKGCTLVRLAGERKARASGKRSHFDIIYRTYRPPQKPPRDEEMLPRKGLDHATAVMLRRTGPENDDNATKFNIVQRTKWMRRGLIKLMNDNYLEIKDFRMLWKRRLRHSKGRRRRREKQRIREEEKQRLKGTERVEDVDAGADADDEDELYLR